MIQIFSSFKSKKYSNYSSSKCFGQTKISERHIWPMEEPTNPSVTSSNTEAKSEGSPEDTSEAKTEVIVLLNDFFLVSTYW